MTPKGVRYGGRAKGTPNKATADIKALAQVHTPRALQILADIMEASESDAARVAAVKELLDRGHGKSRMSEEDAATLTNSSSILAAAWARVRPPNAA